MVVSVGVSALRRKSLHFVDPGVKFNRQYYRYDLLSEIREPSADLFVFEQDGAPAHSARDMVDLLTRETPDFIPPNIWPTNSPEWNLDDYQI